MKNLGLYVHIPFCASKCKYCNFNSYAGHDEYKQEYLASLCAEIKSNRSKCGNHMVTTIYIGGGTPSTMPTGAIATIIDVIKTNYKVIPDAEISIEANPNTINYAKAREWKTAGVNRVSVGLQSTKRGVLNRIGRTHNVKDYINAIKVLKSVGFDNINTDLMIGLPAQKQSQVKHAINLASPLGCSHISCYSLILEENTPLYDDVLAKRVKLPTETKTLNMYNFAYMYLNKLGYHRYEVSNFAKDGKICKHNYNTWSMVEYLGFGAGAHSYFNGKRTSNFEDICEYIKHVKSGNPTETEEVLTSNEQFEETVMLGLRKTEGISLVELNEKFGINLREVKAKQLYNLVALGLIKIEKDRIFATDYGFSLLNKVILELVY